MARKLPPFVERWRDRHGRIRVYGRRGKGPRVPLPSNIGSDAFNESYSAFLSGELTRARPKRADPKPGTIAALVTSYLASRDFRELRVSTKRSYGPRLEELRTAHGHRTVSGMRRAGVDFILAPYADRPGSLALVQKVLKILVKHAIALDWLTHDPTLGIKAPKTREIRSWTEPEIAQFEAHWAVGTKERLAFALHVFTGQRRSDVRRMTWSDVHGSTISVVQMKTGAALSIPLHASLRAVLAATPREHVTLVATARGQAFSINAYSKWLRGAIEAAGLPRDCRVHGLRKVAGRWLAEAGCTAHEIMSVLGHRSLSEAERYTRGANQQSLASAAILKLEARNGTNWPKPIRKGLGKKTKTKVISAC
jgi:integrase